MLVQPSDPRIQRSRSALEAALRELIADRDLPQISISDVTKRAGINRSTFYEHYTDLQDLAASACTTVFDELVAAATAADKPATPVGHPGSNSLPILFAHVAEHAPLYRSLLGPDGSARVINHLLQRLAATTQLRRGATETTPSTQADDPTEVPPDPAAVFLAGAVLGTVIDWLRRGCPDTPERMAAAIWPHLVRIAAAEGYRSG